MASGTDNAQRLGKCRVEYWLAALLRAAAAQCRPMPAIAGAPSRPVSWRCLCLCGCCSGGNVARSTGDLEIARRLDKDLASEERVQTLVENRQARAPQTAIAPGDGRLFSAAASPAQVGQKALRLPSSPGSGSNSDTFHCVFPTLPVHAQRRRPGATARGGGTD